MRPMRLAVLLLISSTAVADEQIAQQRTALWPVTLNVHALIGGEMHGSRGSPVAMGVGGEVLWRGIVGGFAELLASEGTSLIAAKGQDALPDRISLPLGVAVRPFAKLVEAQSSWLQRVAASFGVQAGASMEHLRISSDDATTAAFHLAFALELPVYRGPLDGGVALKLYGRLIAGPGVTIVPTGSSPGSTQARMDAVSGQLFAGLVWYP
jgi:hypothetical protein